MDKLNTQKIILLTAVLFLFPITALAQDESIPGPVPALFADTEVVSEVVVVEEASLPPVIEEPELITNIMQAILEAKAKLEQERLVRLDIWGGKGPVYNEFPAKAEIILAVWRQDAGVVNLYLADKQ